MIKLPQQEMSVEALKALIAEAEACKPAEGSLYQLTAGSFVYRYHKDEWQRRPSNGHVFERADQSTVSCWWQQGALVPYTPPPPTFQVGQWVRPIDEADFSRWWNCKPLKVLPPDRDAGFTDAINPTLCTWTDGGWSETRKLRLATPEEIAAATRIQPKVGMLLKSKRNGTVSRIHELVNSGAFYVEILSRHGEIMDRIASASTEDYEVLDSYTMQGVR